MFWCASYNLKENPKFSCFQENINLHRNYIESYPVVIVIEWRYNKSKIRMKLRKIKKNEEHTNKDVGKDKTFNIILD